MVMFLEVSPDKFVEWHGESIAGVLYPRSIEQHWSAEDLRAIGLLRNDMITPADPIPVGKAVSCARVEQRDGVVKWVHNLIDEPVASLADRRATQIARIESIKAAKLIAGTSHAGKLFAMDDTSRTDLAGMAATAALVLTGALSWPDNYATGWIALDNTRLPLATPADGIALAAAVVGNYAAVVQHARDLKDTVLIADAPEAVDIESGW